MGRCLVPRAKLALFRAETPLVVTPQGVSAGVESPICTSRNREIGFVWRNRCPQPTIAQCLPPTANWLCFAGAAPGSSLSQLVVHTALVFIFARPEIGFVSHERAVRSDAARRFRRRGEPRMPCPGPGNWLRLCRRSHGRRRPLVAPAPASSAGKLALSSGGRSRVRLIAIPYPHITCHRNASRQIGFVCTTACRLPTTEELGSFGATASPTDCWLLLFNRQVREPREQDKSLSPDHTAFCRSPTGNGELRSANRPFSPATDHRLFRSSLMLSCYFTSASVLCQDKSSMNANIGWALAHADSSLSKGGRGEGKEGARREEANDGQTEDGVYRIAGTGREGGKPGSKWGSLYLLRCSHRGWTLATYRQGRPNLSAEPRTSCTSWCQSFRLRRRYLCTARSHANIRTREQTQTTAMTPRAAQLGAERGISSGPRNGSNVVIQ
jgi:hypothetical protein